MPDAFDPISGYDPANVTRSAIFEIEAPASMVWEILTDLPRYGEWNPFCVRAESTLEIGAPIHMYLTNFWNSEIKLNIEYVCANDPEKMLSWAWITRRNGPMRRGATRSSPRLGRTVAAMNPWTRSMATPVCMSCGSAASGSPRLSTARPRR